ncbi:hypothetical protein HPB51_012584 [Rhipicephalus microplus]|uniref:Uncharacterized protein n=1 Tax=Rhipicephalus microplus TaxID=6941 RepID=A0A9J6DGD6_RHIMP|nr:hypothetical protein HPB51_012584 [Rhipicephalus microplus]
MLGPKHTALIAESYKCPCVPGPDISGERLHHSGDAGDRKPAISAGRQVTYTSHATSAPTAKQNTGVSDVPPGQVTVGAAEAEKDAPKPKPVESARRGLESAPHTVLEASTESDVSTPSEEYVPPSQINKVTEVVIENFSPISEDNDNDGQGGYTEYSRFGWFRLHVDPLLCSRNRALDSFFIDHHGLRCSQLGTRWGGVAATSTASRGAAWPAVLFLAEGIADLGEASPRSAVRHSDERGLANGHGCAKHCVSTQAVRWTGWPFTRMEHRVSDAV